MKQITFTPGRARTLCGMPPPPALAVGIEQFNRGEFYSCHDTLEVLWKATPEPTRDLYKGIIQVGGAMFHERKGNRKGAIRMLRRAVLYVGRHAPACHGIDVSRLVADAVEALVWLLHAAPDETFPERLLPRIHFLDGAEPNGAA